MSAIEAIIGELLTASEMSAAGAQSLLWRARIQKLKAPLIGEAGEAAMLVASAARTLLLQRGQLCGLADSELAKALPLLATALQLELQAQQARRESRNARRRGERRWGGG